MSRTHITACSFAFVLAALVGITNTVAHAAPRTFVASFGVDTNIAANCSLAAPCRGFTAAQTVTDNNGEIIVLDSAGYGTFTITKSISIIAPVGVYAGISVLFRDGVVIATTGVNVVLRGLNINSQNGGTGTGIVMAEGNSLVIENCVISNFGQQGIFVSAPAAVTVTDTTIRRNGVNGIYIQSGARGTITRAVVSGNGDAGIRVEGNTANTTTADIADSTMDGNLDGVVALSNTTAAAVKVSVRDSRAVRNSNYGLAAQSLFGAAVSLSVSNNIVSNNGTGIATVFTGATVIASGNTVTNNATNGFINSGGVFKSAGNNTVENNGANAGTITVVATQ